MKPKISIITICYNAQAHIKEAIESVINQNYANKEYIIIDGGSTDNTLDIISSFEDSITKFISEPDNGISDAFNKGIRLATGDIIGICNADDKLCENMLEELANMYQEGIDIYRLQEYIWNDQTNKKVLIKPTPIRKIPIQTHLLHMGCWITKEAYSKYGLYREDFRYCMDYELLRRMIYKGAKSKYCKIPAGFFRLGGVSQSLNNRIEDEKKLICEMYGGGILGGYFWVYFDRLKRTIKNIR